MFTKKTISRIFSVLFTITFILSITPGQAAHAAGMRYADPGGTGDCSSWANACELQTALTGASSGDEIWVAAGTYKPTMGTDRTATFQLKDGVALYGGFAGGETARSQRNWTTNVTILSGDIGTAGDNSDNSYNVVIGAGGALDGFTITSGNANSSGGTCPGTGCGGGMENYSSNTTLTNVIFSGNSASEGGGMFNDNSSPTLTNVTFSGNQGGGMDLSGSSPTLTNVTFIGNQGGGMYDLWFSSPTLTNVTFSGNSATEYGGGMDNFNNSDPILKNVTFSDNTATKYGGGMYNELSSPTLTNVTFSGNSANIGGGGMGNGDSSLTLTNVTFSGNSASEGGGMDNGNSNPGIRNTIFWNNTASTGAQIYNDSGSTPSMSDSVVESGYAGGTNIITADPMLGALGDYGGFTQTIPLLAGSSAIDTGNDTVCPATDQRGVNRPQGAHCDIGAYELYIETTPPAVNTFTVTTPSNSLAIPITAFSATDNVTGYLITTSATPPAADAASWTGTAPTTYTVASDGSYTLYPWAKDAAGYVSAVFASPRAVVVDTTAPTVQTITRADTNPTSAASVNFTVTFSEAVMGVDATAFTLITTGISGAAVTGISGAGSIYTVTVNTGSGNGTIRLDVPASATTITDLALNPLAGLPYTGGETYTITKTVYIFLPLILR